MNYSPCKPAIETRTRSVLFEPAKDGVATIEHFSFQDIEYINSRCGVFRKGELRFEEDEESEIFEALKCPNWRDTLLSEDDINDLVINSNKENAEKIISIKDSSTIERIRGRMGYLINEHADISTKIQNIINDRAKEIRNGQLNSNIIIGSISKVNSNSSAENDALRDELAQLKAMVELLSKAKEPSENASNSDTNAIKKETAKPKTTKVSKI